MNLTYNNFLHPGGHLFLGQNSSSLQSWRYHCHALNWFTRTKSPLKRKKGFWLVLLPKSIYCITESLVPSTAKLLVKKLFVIPELMWWVCQQPFQKPHHPTVCSFRSVRQSSTCLPLGMYLVPLTCCFHSRLERLSTYLKIGIHLPFPFFITALRTSEEP